MKHVNAKTATLNITIKAVNDFKRIAGQNVFFNNSQKCSYLGSPPILVSIIIFKLQ